MYTLDTLGTLDTLCTIRLQMDECDKLTNGAASVQMGGLCAVWTYYFIKCSFPAKLSAIRFLSIGNYCCWKIMYTRPSVDRYGSFLLPDYHECIYLSLEMDIIILMSMLQLFCKLHCFKHLHIPCQGSTFKRFLFVLGCSQILILKHISSKLAHKRLRASKKFG